MRIEKTLIVDGNNILMRSVKAAEGRMHLSVEHDGREINTAPLLLFVNMLSKYIRRFNPERVVVTWDGGRSAHRLAIYPDYKAQRLERGEEKDNTPFSLAKQFLTMSGIPHVELVDVEADDLIAAYVHRHDPAYEEFFILSADKDFLQLVGVGVTQIRPGTDDPEAEVWDYQRVQVEMGCPPREIASIMALTGDSGDGVPGIPGFGNKTAAKYLARYNWSLDALLSSDEAKIADHKDAIRMNLALVDLTRPVQGIEVPSVPRFSPVGPSSLLYPDLIEWLTKFRLDSIKNRLSTNQLWR